MKAARPTFSRIHTRCSVTIRIASSCTLDSLIGCTSRIIAASIGSTDLHAAGRAIGENMPKTIGDIGFPVVVHPEQPDVAWVFPMDGTEVWPRTAIDGKPAVFMTTDGGESWRRQDTGLPRSQAWFTVLRQAMCADAEESLGLYFGTTSGEVWASANAGESWNCIARHLPEIYGVSVAH